MLFNELFKPFELEFYRCSLHGLKETDRRPSRSRTVSSCSGAINNVAKSLHSVSKGVGCLVKAQELSKNKSLSREQREEALAKYRAELYTPREMEVLKGSSNAGYHYNGSAKIMAQIGKGFAEAMAKMSESPK